MRAPPIRRAIEAVGGQGVLARKVGVTTQAVANWAKGKQRIPAERAVAIEEATNGLVNRSELRPDLWPEVA